MDLKPIHLIAQMIHERSQLSHQPRRWSSLSSERQSHYLFLAKKEFDDFVKGEQASRSSQTDTNGHKIVEIFANEAVGLKAVHLKYDGSKLDGKEFIDYLKSSPIR